MGRGEWLEVIEAQQIWTGQIRLRCANHCGRSGWTSPSQKHHTHTTQFGVLASPRPVQSPPIFDMIALNYPGFCFCVSPEPGWAFKAFFQKAPH